MSNDETIKQDQDRAEEVCSEESEAKQAAGANGSSEAAGESDCRGEGAAGEGGSDAQGRSEGDHAKDEGDQAQAQAESDKAQEEEALNMKYMRLMADFQNFKRRTEKEKSDIYAFANEKIVSELLNVIDNFERALDAATEGDSFEEGMKLIFKQLQGVLEKAGVVEIEALGKDFDPNFHNAVMMEDSTEYESGKVTEVLQKGYLLNNRVIRPSMVKVAN